MAGHIDVIVKEDCNNNIGDNIHNYIIIVKDNGRGIDEKDMPSLFDLYTRGAYDNDISVEGTGAWTVYIQAIIGTYEWNNRC